MIRVVSEYVARLAPRERVILLVGGFAAAAMLLWAYGVDPMFSGARDLDKLTLRKHETAQELAQVLAEYQRLNRRIGSASTPRNRVQNFSLLSFLEGLSAKAQVKGNIQYMRPTTSDVAEGIREHAVEVKLTNIGLAAMSNLVSSMESSPQGLRVKRLHIKRRFSDPNLLDVTFVVAYYEEI